MKYVQKLVLIVRTDLKMSEGKVASQCAHAAIECYLKGKKGLMGSIYTKLWVMSGQPKIVLKAKDEKELLSLATSAEKAGLITASVRDAGRTQVRPGTITVLGIGPGAANRIDTITSHLKLL